MYRNCSPHSHFRVHTLKVPIRHTAEAAHRTAEITPHMHHGSRI